MCLCILFYIKALHQGVFYKLLTAGFNNGSDSNVAQDALCTTQDGGFQNKTMSKNEQKNLNVTKLF